MTVAAVAIEPLAPESCARAAAWIADPRVNHWLYAEWRERPVSEALVAAVAMNAKNRLFMVRDDGAEVGLVALSQISSHDRHASLWYLLGETGLGGRGIETTAVGLLAGRAFAEFGLHSLDASVHEPNVASRRVLEKNGFRLAGRLRGAFVVDGAYVDRLLYERLSEDAVAR